jgi:excisionase family DNA binding protein
MTDPPVFVTSSEAARRLGVSEESIRRLCRAGVLRAHRIYSRGRWRIRLDDVERLLAPREAA